MLKECVGKSTNAVGHEAYKPHAVLPSHKGLTVQVNSRWDLVCISPQCASRAFAFAFAFG